MQNQGKNSRVVWQRASELSDSSVMCLDCKVVLENKREFKSHHPTDIVHHLKQNNHKKIQIMNNSNKTSIKVVQCFNCFLSDVFSLRIYILSGNIFLICSDCAKDNNTVIRDRNQSYSQFSSLDYQRVVENHAINSILVKLKLTKSDQNNQNTQVNQVTPPPSKIKMNLSVITPHTIANDIEKKPKQQSRLLISKDNKEKSKSDKDNQLIGSDKVLKNQIPTQPGKSTKSTKVQKINDKNNIMCLDCKNLFNNKKYQNVQKSHLIKHLMKAGHNRIQIFQDEEKKTSVIPQCTHCGKRNIFNISICKINNAKYLLCSQCLQNNNCSILSNNPDITRKQISSFPNEPLVINFFLNATFLNQNFDKAQSEQKQQQQKNIYERKQKESEQSAQINKQKAEQAEQQEKAVDATVTCLQCNNTFLNERKKPGSVTDIVRHLKRCNHNRIEISKKAQKTNISKFECLSCNIHNIFILSLVEISSFYIILCKNCITNKQLKFEHSNQGLNDGKISLESQNQCPIISNGAINPIIMNLTIKERSQQKPNNQDLENKAQQDRNVIINADDEGNMIMAAEEKVNFQFAGDNDDEEEDFEFLDSLDDIKALQADKKNQTNNIPCQFTNCTDYRLFFKQLLSVETKESQKQINQLSFTTDVVVSDNSICQISFNNPLSSNQVKEGSELSIQSKQFQETCYVEKLDQEKVIANTEKPIMDSKKNTIIRNVKVSSKYPKVIFDRMIQGIKNFIHVDHKLQKSILGSLIQSEKNIESTDSLEIIGEKNKNSYNHLNKSQRAAIESSNDCILSLIQGPPGTGKTETAAHLVVRMCETLNNNRDQSLQKKKILVCAPSNLAADNIANRIHEINKSINIYRVISQSRQRVKIEYQYKKIILHLNLNNKYQFSKRERKEEALSLLREAEVICTTCINSVDSYIKDFVFETVIIDESNQAIEPESLISLQQSARQLILVGDHKQLPPIVSSMVAAKNGLKRSLFSRLIQIGHKPHFLSYQYRMHPGISQLSSSIFYSNRLIDAVTEQDRIPNQKFPWLNQRIPIQFYNINGYETTLQDGRSYQNEYEANYIVELVKQLKQAGIQDEEIGIITPYSSQATLIKKMIGNSIILVDTAYSFQGKEKEYIIVSCVRVNSYNNLGVLRNPQLINVTITRARRGLLFVGNKQHLSKSKWWKKVFDNLETNKLCIDVSSKLAQRIETLDDDKEILFTLDNRFVFIQKN